METFFTSKKPGYLNQTCSLSSFLLYCLKEVDIMVYKTSGVCSSAISFEIDEQGKVHDVKFQGGCSGNTQGVAKLIEGMDAKEAISRLEGIRCGFRPTSCPDQLSKALKEALNSIQLQNRRTTSALRFFASFYIDFYLQFFMTDHLGPIYHTMTALLL